MESAFWVDLCSRGVAGAAGTNTWLGAARRRAIAVNLSNQGSAPQHRPSGELFVAHPGPNASAERSVVGSGTRYTAIWRPGSSLGFGVGMRVSTRARCRGSTAEYAAPLMRIRREDRRVVESAVAAVLSELERVDARLEVLHVVQARAVHLVRGVPDQRVGAAGGAEVDVQRGRRVAQAEELDELVDPVHVEVVGRVAAPEVGLAVRSQGIVGEESDGGPVEDIEHVEAGGASPSRWDGRTWRRRRVRRSDRC